MKSLRVAACVAIVILVYELFASGGTWKFRKLHWHEQHSESLGADYYVRLAEGFRTGHLYMAASVDPRMEQLADPHDPEQRAQAGIDALWDASYHRGHYYLYHSPVPVLLFYLPYRLARGLYPSDPAAAVFFCGWALLTATLFLMRVVRERVGLWVLVAGLGNVIAFLLPDIRVYEVAVMCGMAMSMTWAWTFLRFVEAPSTRSAIWMGVFLALSIATRPHFIVLLIPTAIALWFARNRRVAIAALLPIAISTAILWSYNYARFGNPLEVGTHYQIEFTSMKGKRVCSICNTKEVLRLFNNAEHYLFVPPVIDGRFPFVSLQLSHLDPEVSAPLGADTIVGLLPMLPVAAFGLFFALLLRRNAATGVMLGAALILGALSSCWWVVARYTLDFTMLFAVTSAIMIERGLEQFGTRMLRFVTTALATYSILLGFLLGFEGLGGSFRRVNPALYQAIGKTLHVKVRQ